MAVVFTPDTSGDSALAVALASGWWLVSGTLTFSGTYPAGGEPLDLTKVIGSGGKIRRVIAMGNYRGALPEYIKSASKLMLWFGTAVTPTQAEHAAAAYDADLLASAVDAAFLIKFG